MPELPEVETTCRGLSPHLEGHTIRHVIIRQPRLRWEIPADLTQHLTGARIQTLERRAKYLLFHTHRGIALAHLGMSGRLRIVPIQTPPEKHDHYDWQLNNKTCLRYTDPRRFGCLLWLGNSAHHPLLDNLGPEPLTEAFDGDYLWQQTRGRTTAIKLLLMNNAVVVGVGNIYASESLFRAGIRPTRPAHKIRRDACEQLVSSIKLILQKAILAGGTSFRDFVAADGKPGYFQQELYVYGRDGEACKRCGNAVQAIQQGQRSTFFCAHCQK
jgi:formamidopyrimidine-DNA glycosylase